MNAIVIFMLVLFLLGLWRHMNQKYASIKFRVRMSNLIVDLDKLVEARKIEDSDSVKYFRKLLSSSISAHYFITIFGILLASLRKRKHSKETLLFFEEIKKNKELNFLHERMNCIVFMYLKEQHYGSYVLIIKPALMLGISYSNTKMKVENYLNSLSSNEDINSRGLAIMN